MQAAVFLDKDGTLVTDVPYNVDPAQITFEAGVIDGLKVLKQLGFLLIVVSNQSGVARGKFEYSALGDVTMRLQNTAVDNDFSFDAFYFCPHHPCGIVDKYSIECTCRKPEPGMLLMAAIDFGIDLSASWMVGDILNDVEAGNRAGCQSILINNGNETEWHSGKHRTPFFVASGFSEAVHCIATITNRKKHGKAINLPGLHTEVSFDPRARHR